ncbi:MAG: hypothetical protein HQL37_10310, partial [Alphaproteobacteria bacterium]|nr:hypothetical protein [Alphaproteobacteria bacterium]
MSLHDLPPETQTAYLQRRVRVDTAEANPALWDAFQRSPAGNQNEALRRHPIMMALSAKIEAGATLAAARTETFRETGIDPQSLQRWYSRVDGKPKADWLPLLKPDWKQGVQETPVHEDVWRFYAGWLGRPEKPKFKVAYRKTKEAAECNGWVLPSSATMRRRWQALDERLKVKWREGTEALDPLYPYQERAREQLHAMEGTNTDSRILDLNVIWPDGKQGRCAVVALMVDDYSGYPLAYRFDRTENGDQYRLLTAEVFENYGVPTRMTFDNTMAAANKILSGGTKHRF